MSNNLANGKDFIKAEGLEKSYGKNKVVHGIDLHLQSGEVVGLLGPNGAGKTTSFYMIVGLVAASAGKVLFNDKDITDAPMYKRARYGIGYLPQEASVFRKLTVKDNLKAIAETLPILKTDQMERIHKIMEELGLLRVAHQKAYTLSGGERRRLEIARSLLTEPKFLLMDEPFSGVDPINVSEVQRIVLQLKRKGIGVIITDHNVRETLKIVDRAYLLHEGKILAEGSSDFLINDENSRRFYLGENFTL